MTENVLNSEKHAMRMRNDVDFYFFKIYEYSSIKNGISVYHSIHSLKIKGQTFYRFEIISLAIKRIALLCLNYLHISVIFFSNQRLGYHLSNFRRCFSANWFNQGDALPTIPHFTFSMGSSVHSGKVCLKKWNKVQCSKPILSETFCISSDYFNIFVTNLV